MTESWHMKDEADWKQKMTDIGAARLSELKDLITHQKKLLSGLEKEYAELWATLQSIGWKPTIHTEVQGAEVMAQADLAVFRWEIPASDGHQAYAWNLRQRTVDRILSDEVPSPFHIHKVQELVSLEVGRYQSPQAWAQAARGYISYLLRTGKIERGQRKGWYLKVGGHTPAPALKPDPPQKQGPEAYEHEVDLFLDNGVVTTQKPEPKGYGT